LKTSTRILAIGLAFTLFIGPSAFAANIQQDNNNQYTLQEQRTQRLEQLEQFRVDDLTTQENRATFRNQFNEEELSQHREQFRIYVDDVRVETLARGLRFGGDGFLEGLANIDFIVHISAEPLRNFLLARSPHIAPEDLLFPPAMADIGHDALIHDLIGTIQIEYALDTGLLTFEEFAFSGGFGIFPDNDVNSLIARYIELVRPQSFFMYHVQAADNE